MRVRPQIGFHGVCDSLALCRLEQDGSDVVKEAIDHHHLADAFFERELLVALRAAGLPLPPASFAVGAGAGGPGNEMHVRGLAELGKALPPLKAAFRKFWCLEHDQRCTRRGKCRLLVMDGNAKLWRRCCSQRFRFYDVLPGYGWVHRGCPRRPVPGFYDCQECMPETAQATVAPAADAGEALLDAEAEAARPAYASSSEGEGDCESCEGEGEEDGGAEDVHAVRIVAQDLLGRQVDRVGVQRVVAVAYKVAELRGRELQRERLLLPHGLELLRGLERDAGVRQLVGRGLV